MSFRRPFILPAVLVITTRVMDLCATWYESPDLHNEVNPIIALHGGGWGALIVANVAGVTLILAGLWKRATGPPLTLPTTPGLALLPFAKRLWLGPRARRRWWHWITGKPGDHRIILQFVGAVGAPTLIGAGLLAAAHNTLLRTSGTYRIGPAMWAGLAAVYLFVVFGVLWFSFAFFRQEYARYLASSSKVHTEHHPAGEAPELGHGSIEQ